MKKIVLLAAAMMLMGCEGDNIDTSRSIDYSVVKIDSCEYIRTCYKLAHKGDCKYCEERRKKEYREVLKELFDMQE